MTDNEKITTLRDALKECQDITDNSDIYDTCGQALAMTAEASEAARDAPIPFMERMAAHYEQGGKVICEPAEWFMQQEIADWRARSDK